MSITRALPFLCLALVVIGCDETPTTAPVTESQGIAGQVISKEVDIEVAAWQAHLIASTIADSAGYFFLDEIPVGLYEVRFTTPTGRKLTIRSVMVQEGVTTSLKEIRLSPPSWPLWDVTPLDSTRGLAPLSPGIRIVSTESLDLYSLETSVSFAPPLDGVWRTSTRYASPGYSLYSYYDYEPIGALDVATEYVMTIGPGLAVSGGQTWNDSLRTVFFTDSLRLLELRTGSYYYSSGGNLLEPRRAFTLTARFNARVNPDSLTKATSFTPPITGVWLSQAYDREPSVFNFFNTGDLGLRAEQTYLLHIDGDVALVGSSPSSTDVQVPLKTAPLQVLDTYPPQGYIDHCSSCAVAFLFNSEMDSSSLVLAIALTTFGGTPVSGQTAMTRSDVMYFYPDSLLASDTVYVAKVSADAASLWGDHLKEPFELYFRVR